MPARRLHFGLALSAGLAALVTAVASAHSAAPEPLLRTSGPVQELAANAANVALTVGRTKADCDHALVWNPLERSVVRLGTSRRPCARVSTGEGLYGLALAGRRAAGVHYVGGNVRELSVLTSTIGLPRATTRLSFSSYDLDLSAGDFAGDARGGGSQLVFATWHACTTAEVGTSRCRPGTVSGIDAERLWQVTGGGKRMLASAQGELSALAVGGGLVAARRGDGSLALLSADGSTRRVFRFRPGEARAAVLTAPAAGPTLVVLRRDAAGGDALLVYDVVRGTLERTWRLPAARTSGPGQCGAPPDLCPARPPVLRLEDVESGIAVYVLGRDVHLLRLSDGRDVTLAAAGVGTVHAQLEPVGLWYSYAEPSSTLSGRVAFVPFRDVLRRLG